MVNFMDAEKLSQDIISTIKVLNRSWTGSWNEQDLRQCLHPEVVAIVPDVPGRLEGREAYVAALRMACEVSVIDGWSETDHHVQIYNGGKSAVVTFFFTITSTVNGQKQTLRGRDMVFLVKEGRKWLVVADQFSPEPEPT
jgi:ketosteroid isomerase-like protein